MIIHPNVNKNTGRGTFLYVHNTISHKQLSISPDDEEFQEALFTEIKLNAKETLWCACLYRRGESDPENINKLFQTIRTILDKEYSHILIMGDFNMKDIGGCFYFQHIT